METLAIVFVIAWAAVGAYLAWMGIQHTRLAHRLSEMETLVHDQRTSPPQHSRAA